MRQSHLFEALATAEAFAARDYQFEAVEAILAAFERYRRVMLVLAPRLGKTKTAAMVVKRLKGRVLWLADTDFLLDQARVALEEVTGEQTTLEQAQHHMGSERIVVASMQTLRAERLLRLSPDEFELVIPDEAHGVLAPTYRRIIEHFADALCLGLSATPFRLDKKQVVGPGGFFEHVAYEKTVSFGVSEGYLVPVDARIREVKEIDLSQVRMHGGDLKLGDLEKQIIKAAAPIAHMAWEESNGGELPALIYTPGVASAKAVAATFRALAVDRWGPEACVSIDGETPRGTRLRVRQEFGKSIRGIANCDLLTQGVDLPRARLVVLGRPTMSLALFQQMSLRGAGPMIPELMNREARLEAIRTSEKPWFRLVDLAGNSGRHSLVTVVEGLGGDLSSLEQAKLRERLSRPRPSGETLDESVAEAKKASADEVRRELERSEIALAQAAAQTRVTAVAKGWDPFKRIGAPEFDADSIAPEWLDQQPTAEQIVFLRKNKIPVKLQTRATAEALQRQARKWTAQGMATIRQRAVLSRAGLDPNQPYEMASRLYEALAKWRFQPKRAQADINRVLSEGRVAGED